MATDPRGGAPSAPESLVATDRAADVATGDAATGGHELRELRRRAAAIAHEIWGRGPERCEAHWAGPDLLVVVFHGGLTAAEISLKQSGESAEAERGRENFRRAVEPHLRDVAAALTGRSVRAAIGASRLDPDMTIEAFVMAPVGSEPPPGSLSARLSAAEQAATAARDMAHDEAEAAAAVQAQAAQAARHAQEVRDASREGRTERRQGSQHTPD